MFILSGFECFLPVFLCFIYFYNGRIMISIKIEHVLWLKNKYCDLFRWRDDVISLNDTAFYYTLTVFCKTSPLDKIHRTLTQVKINNKQYSQSKSCTILRQMRFLYLVTWRRYGMPPVFHEKDTKAVVNTWASPSFDWNLS